MNFTDLSAMFLASYQPHSESVFATPGTSSFTVPNNVRFISVVCIGGGGSGGSNNSTTNGGSGGAGGALAYVNNLPVSGGQLFQVVVASSSLGTVAGGNGDTG